MDAPKCKICGDKHWSADPCKLTATIVTREIAQLAKPKFDRKAYQRDLMRKRRAALKDGIARS